MKTAQAGTSHGTGISEKGGSPKFKSNPEF
jgi:hypothetical protein